MGRWVGRLQWGCLHSLWCKIGAERDVEKEANYLSTICLESSRLIRVFERC